MTRTIQVSCNSSGWSIWSVWPSLSRPANYCRANCNLLALKLLCQSNGPIEKMNHKFAAQRDVNMSANSKRLKAGDVLSP